MVVIYFDGFGHLFPYTLPYAWPQVNVHLVLNTRLSEARHYILFCESVRATTSTKADWISGQYSNSISELYVGYITYSWPFISGYKILWTWGNPAICHLLNLPVIHHSRSMITGTPGRFREAKASLNHVAPGHHTHLGFVKKNRSLKDS